MQESHCYDLMLGWRAEVQPSTRGGLDELTLYRRGENVWRMEIPPQLPEDELISQARMYATIFDRGVEYTAGKVMDMAYRDGCETAPGS